MSVLDCIVRLEAQKKISSEQADRAKKIYEGLVNDAALGNMDQATREGYAAFHTAEILSKEADRRKIELAARTERYNTQLERQNAHPDGPLAGFTGLMDRDIRNAPGQRDRENVTSLEREHYFPQIMAKLHEADEAFRSKMAGLKQDTAGVRQMVYELFNVDTKNAIAKAAADGMRTADDFAVKTAQGLHRVFDRLDEWRLPQDWKSSKVEKAGAQQATADIMKHVKTGMLDLVDPVTGRFADTTADQARIVQEAVENIRKDMSVGAGGSGVFNRNSRVFRFKDGKGGADAYLDLMDKYGPGRGGYYSAIQGHYQAVSHELAMLHMFGPGYGATTDKLLQAAIEGDKVLKMREADRIAAGGEPVKRGAAEKVEDLLARTGLESPHAATRLNDYINGRLSKVGNQTMATFFDGIRAWIASAKLLSAPITAVPGDAANWVLASRFRGLNTGRLAGDIVSHLLTGPGDKEALAARLGITAHAVSRVAIGTKQYGDQIFGSGPMQRIADFGIRLSRLHAYDSAMTRAFPTEFMASIGDNAGKTFDQLDAPFKQFWTDYGFTPEEWGKISNGEMLDVAGTKYFMPDSLEGNLRAKLMSAVGDEKQFAYLAGGSSRIRAMAAGPEKGTFAGEMARGMFMFKTFPLSLLATHGMRAAQQAQQGKMGYAIALGLFTTMAGAVAIQAQQALSGKDPREMFTPSFWAQAALKGGALGVYGDAMRDLLTGAGTASNTLAETVQGPISGLLGSIGRVLGGTEGELEKGKGHPGKALSEFLRQWTPGSNLWYTQLIFNRAIMDNIQRMIDPTAAASFVRAKANALKNYGQHFWWAPGEGGPQRAPNLSTALPTPQ